MKRIYYDLHVHSCLSPCAEDDMTPFNIAGMAHLAGLDVVALTDHNTCRNCPAFFAAARKYGIVPVPGMEITTAEDIHAVCLFPSLEAAMEFGSMVDGRRMKIPNNETIFGHQYVIGSDDEITGAEEFYLHAATDIMIDDLTELTAGYSGVCYPAHVDRQSNGIIAVLGTFPEDLRCKNAEFYDISKKEEYLSLYPALREKRIVVSSDAHNLWSIRDKNAFFELETGEGEEEIRKSVIDLLKGTDR